jgi:hypothetical protein
MSAVIAFIIRVLALFGVSLSPFAAGAIVAGGFAALLGGGSLALYAKGYAAADGKCDAAALQSRVDVLEADRDAARRALADARLKATSIELQANADKEGTAVYVEQLKADFKSVCAITDDDLRGMRVKQRGRAASGIAAGGRLLDAARRRAAGSAGR